MNNKLSICILLCLVMLASGLAEAQGTYGTKVQAGDPDIGLPLSQLSATILPALPFTPQAVDWVAYWDIGTTPNVYDDKDVIYLQLGSIAGGPQKIVRANNIRLTAWGSYPAGSYVKPGDSDIGQQVVPVPIGVGFAATGFSYMDVSGGPGYDMGDPVYLKVAAGANTNTNDVRITTNAGFPSGSKVSLSDPDANRPLLLFNGPMTPIGVTPPQVGSLPIARISFFNANGNIFPSPPWPANQPIYDEGDVVYFDVAPLNVVSPNDIRLF
ncbi:MAG TPA: hypothetical protein PLZ44_06365 [Methanothrix sp.]|nr:hypothetical protein [Methanothrix sp.]